MSFNLDTLIITATLPLSQPSNDQVFLPFLTSKSSIFLYKIYLDKILKIFKKRYHNISKPGIGIKKLNLSEGQNIEMFHDYLYIICQD